MQASTSKPFQIRTLLTQKSINCTTPLYSYRLNANRWQKHAQQNNRLHCTKTIAFTTEPAPNIPKPGAKASIGTISSKYWPCKDGRLVRVLQQHSKEDGIYIVQILIEDLAEGQQADITWGVYRSSPHAWQHPSGIIPPNSQLDESSGTMKTPMQQLSSTSQTITFEIPESLAPITFAFVISTTDPRNPNKKPKFTVPLNARHFSALVGLQSGNPTPLGPSLLHSADSISLSSEKNAPSTVNFAVRCRGASTVSLVILKPPSEQQQQWTSVEITLDPCINHTGDTWHIAVPGLKDINTLCYGWRISGDVSWESGYRIQPDKILIDPYAPSIVHLPMNESSSTSISLPLIESEEHVSMYLASSMACGGSLNALIDEGVSLPLHRSIEKLRILEIDVATFARGPKVEHPGTFLGVAERADHIKALGANAVVLTPCCATNKERKTVSFFAPDPALSTDPSSPSAAAHEMREMVAALHAAGIEVIPSIDVTLTADGIDANPSTMSLRGLDHKAYYRPNGVLNCGQPAVHDLLLRALRHWAIDFGVDGFCFLSAENMSQDANGVVVDNPPIAESFCHDPLLSRLKLFAAPTNDNLLPRGGSRGFPHWGLWMQRNGTFRRDLTTFIAENPDIGMLDAVAMRLAGSADIFGAQWETGLPGNLAAPRRPAFSLNTVSGSISSGASMQFIAKEAAGVAGAALVASGGNVADIPRWTTIAKSLLLATIFAQGTPVISYPDVADVEMARFVGVVMRLRKTLSPLLLSPLFDSPRDVVWRGANGGEPDWAGERGNDGSANFLSFLVRNGEENGEESDAVFVGFNPHIHALAVALPAPPAGRSWVRAVDTALPAPDDAVLSDFVVVHGDEYCVSSKAGIVLIAA